MEYRTSCQNLEGLRYTRRMDAMMTVVFLFGFLLMTPYGLYLMSRRHPAVLDQPAISRWIRAFALLGGPSVLAALWILDKTHWLTLTLTAVAMLLALFWSAVMPRGLLMTLGTTRRSLHDALMAVLHDWGAAYEEQLIFGRYLMVNVPSLETNLINVRHQVLVSNPSLAPQFREALERKLQAERIAPGLRYGLGLFLLISGVFSLFFAVQG